MNKAPGKKYIAIAVIAFLFIAGFVLILKRSGAKGIETRVIHPRMGEIRSSISTTGTVLPKNRLEVKPPVNGRIESMLVKEGDMVKPGQMLAWMSSNERAALLDAARGKGEAELKYWQEAYKAIPLVASIEGEVIVATVQPGQTVTTNDAVVVLSDRLIVRAQVDETDIGGIKQGQECAVTIDAYPEVKIPGKVEHIYYESKTVNNVTIYEADVLPETIPDFFRSGMNATIEFITGSKKGILILPVDAVQREKGQAFVFISKAGKEAKQPVKIGITDDKNIEILSGVAQGDDVLVRSKRYAIPKESGTNPFMPARRR
ncbi:MAG: efflux RND transporter periplasmic adaptor subunit [Candidatus Omnitrophica bacterium]|nr:efflux RND transporter periplasmic adaptor subunit [Candidatus Omnitrophota bacterium]